MLFWREQIQSICNARIKILCYNVLTILRLISELNIQIRKNGTSA